jgi:hypothetical protein
MGLRSASSSSDHWRSSLSSEEEEDVACAAPLGDNGSMGRRRELCAMMEFFVGCKSWERNRVFCENEVFCWLQEWGEKRALGGRGYLWPEEPIQPLLIKLLPKRLE